MKKYIAKRMFVSIVTILIILLLLFCMLQFMPGSPFNDEKLSEAQVQVLNQKYGLDQPIVVQFVNYVKNVVKGDFGVSYSISKNTEISKLLNTRLPVSFRIFSHDLESGNHQKQKYRIFHDQCHSCPNLIHAPLICTGVQYFL